MCELFSKKKKEKKNKKKEHLLSLVNKQQYKVALCARDIESIYKKMQISRE